MATSDKYDRQLRLWGTNGQKALSETAVICIRATAVGTETLKNLVLPGIGSIVILDDDDDDYGVNNDPDSTNVRREEYLSNFFLTDPSVSSSTASPAAAATTTTTKATNRGHMALQYLQELNPDVKGRFQQFKPNQFHTMSSENWITIFQQQQQEQQQEANGDENYHWLIIGSDLEPNIKMHVSHACHQLQISYMDVSCYGFIGMVRMQCPILPILDPKPTSSKPDLRLMYPFQQLKQFSETAIQTIITNNQNSSSNSSSSSSNSSSNNNHNHNHNHHHHHHHNNNNNTGNWELLTDQQHGHIPYPLILLNMKQQFFDKNPTSNAIQTPEEKQSFRESIRKASRNIHHEINFQEAIDNAYLAYTEQTLDMDHLRHIQSVLQQRTQQQLQVPNSLSTVSSSSSSSNCQSFHILLQALDRFLQSQQKQQSSSSTLQPQPPLHGTIPDMTSSTDLYVQLQTIYKTKAKQDLEQMKQNIHQIISSTNNSTASTTTPTTSPTDQQLETFCKNIHNVDIYDTGTIQDEYNDYNTTSTQTQQFNQILEDLSMATFDPYEVTEHTPLLWYFALRACYKFYQRYDRYPGTALTTDDHDDLQKLQPLLQQLLKQWKLQDNHFFKQHHAATDKILQEFIRYGNAEIHTIASFIGGVASQEAVKIITGQYIPINNTYIYNGIASVGAVYKF